MTVDRFPGNLRVGVLHQQVNGVSNDDPTKADPKISLLWLLAGHQRFRLGAQVIELDARAEACALLFHSKRPLSVIYEFSQGDPLIKTAVSLAPEWIGLLDEGGLPAMSATGPDLDYRLWQPSAALLVQVRALVAASSRICRMTLGLELLNQAVRELNALAPSDDSRVQRVRAYIAQNLHHGISSRDVAQANGIGLRTLQRLFLEQEGISLGAYLQARRIEVGREALERQGLSVAEAAYRAGYSTPENFATAIKRACGLSPRELRARTAMLCSG